MPTNLPPPTHGPHLEKRRIVVQRHRAASFLCPKTPQGLHLLSAEARAEVLSLLESGKLIDPELSFQPCGPLPPGTSKWDLQEARDDEQLG